jgi:hypothetical protein
MGDRDEWRSAIHGMTEQHRAVTANDIQTSQGLTGDKEDQHDNH